MSRIAVAAIAVLICLFVGLAWLAFHYHGKYTAAQSELSSAETVTTNTLTAINLMYDISRATHENKQKLSDEGEARIVYIREAVKGDECAVRTVPDAVTDNLRMLENAARSGLSAKAKP